MSNGIGADIQVKTASSDRSAGTKIVFDGETGTTPVGVQLPEIAGVNYTWYFFEDPVTPSELQSGNYEQLVKTRQVTKRVQWVDKLGSDKQSHVWTNDQLNGGSPTTFGVILHVTLWVRKTDTLVSHSGIGSQTVTIAPASPTKVDSDAPLTEARRLHKEFVTNLLNWKTFQVGGFASQKVTGNVETDQKIRLWTLVTQIIESARNNSNVDSEQIHEALGIDESSYANDYYDRFVSNPDRASISHILGFGAYATEHVGTAALKATKRNISSDPCEYVEFGRRLFAYRSGVVNSAKRLLSYMMVGSADRKNWDRKPTLHRNPFLQFFKRRPYIKQVGIFHELTVGLAQTEVGKQFLGGLFAKRDHSAAIDPFSLYYPPVVSESQKKKLDPSDPIVAIKSTAEREKYFESTYGSLKTENGALTDEARKFASFYYGLSLQLKAGAQFFIKKSNDQVYPNTQAQALDLVGKFQTRVISKVFPESDINQIVTEESQRVKLQTILRTSDITSEQWEWDADSLKFLEHSIDHFDKWATNSRFDNTAYGQRPRLLYEVKAVLIVWSLGTAVYEVTIQNRQDTLTPDDVQKLALTLTKVMADGSEVLSDYGVQFAEKFTKTTFGKLLTKVISPIVDVIFIISDVSRISTQWREHDYDAALVIGASVAISFLIVGLEIAAGSSLFGGVPGVLIAIGAVVGAGMLALENYVNDPEIVGVLKVSAFGTLWADVVDEGLFDTAVDYDDVESLEFDFSKNRTAKTRAQVEANYSRQISKVYTTLNKLGLGEPKLRTDSTNGRYVLEITLEPPASTNLRESGALYFRPYFHGDFCPFIHKVALDDEVAQRGTDHWNSGVAYIDRDWIPFKTQQPNTWAAVMKGYFTRFPHDGVPAKWALDDRAITHGISTDQFRSLSHVSLNPKTTTGSNPPARLRKQGNTWTDTINKVQLEIGTKFPPLLLGIRPRDDRGNLRWPDDTALEVTYVPPELESHIQSESIFTNGELDLGTYPSLSREIRPVSRGNNVQIIRGTGHHEWSWG